MSPENVRELAYGSVTRTSLSPDDAVSHLKAALAQEGWGVLFELDVAAILREKLGATFRPYRILGACKPALALEALGFEEHLGLLMPCNVLVSRDEDGTSVAVVNAREQLRVTNNGLLLDIADRVDEQLARVLKTLPA
ncbi:MAG: DUF302 domain-containing protein [Vulcanimicrobiaceae bacterium]